VTDRTSFRVVRSDFAGTSFRFATREQILAGFPHLEAEDITAALEFGAARVTGREIEVARPA